MVVKYYTFFVSILGTASVAATLLVWFGSTRVIGASLAESSASSASSASSSKHAVLMQLNDDDDSKVSQHLYTFWRRQSNEYLRFLDEFPLITKSATAGMVSFVGDLLAQSLIGGGVQYHHHHDSIDWNRAATVAAEGLFVAGPLLHLAYDWMDQHLTFLAAPDSNATPPTSVGGATVFLSSLVQVLLDIFVMDTIFAMTLLLVSAILQRRTRRQIYDEVRTEYLSTVVAAWGSSLLMSPIQFCNFQFVPVQFRVLITNVQDVVWNAVVSYMAHRHRGGVDTGKSKSA
jgi:Mpv17 / PMP22 family